MPKHIVLTFIGLCLGIALVAWVRPNTAGGTTFLIVVAMLAVNAAGVTATWMIRAIAKPAGPAVASDQTPHHPGTAS